MNRQEIITKVIGIEGGYVDDPNDSGGKTRYGITEAAARRYGYTGDMKDLPIQTAYDIYESEYWLPLKLDQVLFKSEKIAHELFDTGVNQGIGRAAGFFQRSLNALNRQGKLYPDLKVDFSVGPATLRSYNALIDVRGKDGETVLHRMLNSLQGAFYVELVENRQKDEENIFGWFLNRVV